MLVKSRSTGDLPAIAKEPIKKKDKVVETAEEAMGQISWQAIGQTILFGAAVISLVMVTAYVAITVAIPILMPLSPLVAIGFGMTLGIVLGLPLIVVT